MDLEFLKRDHVMVDTESLGIVPGCAIVSIGAVKFRFDTGITDEFYININAESSKKLGMIIDPDTIDWWSRQPSEARRAWMKNPTEPREAFEKFNDWFGNNKQMFWCQGSSADAAWLTVYYDKLKIERPWKYWNEMDLRTVYTMIGVDNRALRAKDDDIHHNALDDAKSQARHLISFFT